MTLLDSLHGPTGLLAELLVAAREKRIGECRVFGGARVAERDERIPPQVPSVVPRDVQPPVALPQGVAVFAQPVGQPHVRFGSVGQRGVAAALLDAAVPRADVLTDVAPIDLRAELRAVLG